MSRPSPSSGGESRQLQSPEDFHALTEIDTSDLPASWIRSEASQKALALSIRERQKKHGLYAGIPILCRGSSCPYAPVCPLEEAGIAPKGDPCALETALILQRAQVYMDELEIDETKVVDMGLLRDLIDCEVLIERCDRLLAKDGEIVQQVDIGITPDGVVVQRPELHQALIIKEKMQKRKNAILQLLNSTRKDAAKMGMDVNDPSTWAARIMRLGKKAREAFEQGMKVVDAEIVNHTESGNEEDES